jgi:hypothetical protein
LLGLYRNEKDPVVKRQILDHLIGTSSAATLVQLARQEADPAVRKRLVERLSTMKDKEAVDYMMEILKKRIFQKMKMRTTFLKAKKKRA